MFFFNFVKINFGGLLLVRWHIGILCVLYGLIKYLWNSYSENFSKSLPWYSHRIIITPISVSLIVLIQNVSQKRHIFVQRWFPTTDPKDWQLFVATLTFEILCNLVTYTVRNYTFVVYYTVSVHATGCKYRTLLYGVISRGNLFCIPKVRNEKYTVILSPGTGW